MKKILLLISAMFVTVSLFGQGLVNVTPDVRTSGMADAYTAMYGKGFSIYTNSASAALSDDDFAISASYSSWQPEMTDNNNFALGAFYKLSDRYTVALGFRGQMMKTGVFVGDKSTNLSVDASFGMHIIEGFAAAINLHFFYDMLMTGTQGIGGGADIDLMYSRKYFNVALSARNLGVMSYPSGTSMLPMDIRLGYSGDYEVVDDILDITPAVDVNYLLNSSTVTAGIGAEFEFIDMISLRGGYRFSADNSWWPSYATVGIGVEFFDFAIDAAYYIGTGVTDVLTNSFKVGLSYKF